jgi:hypothetical protein
MPFTNWVAGGYETALPSSRETERLEATPMVRVSSAISTSNTASA